MPCLTWEMSRNKLDITCRVDNVLLPVSINDMFGKERGKCVFNRFSELCISNNKKTNITASYSKKEVILTVANVPGSVVNGKWSCIQGTQMVTTMISTLAGYTLIILRQSKYICFFLYKYTLRNSCT